MPSCIGFTIHTNIFQQLEFCSRSLKDPRGQSTSDVAVNGRSIDFQGLLVSSIAKAGARCDWQSREKRAKNVEFLETGGKQPEPEGTQESHYEISCRLRLTPLGVSSSFPIHFFPSQNLSAMLTLLFFLLKFHTCVSSI